MLLLKSIQIHLGSMLLLSFDHLEIGPGEIITLLGPSGSGKSTLLKGIAGLSDPEVALSGSVKLDGDEVSALPAHRRRTGYLDQRPVLFPHLNVWQNLAFGLRGAKSQIDEALETASLKEFSKADVTTLSGGQAARVALLRTLLSGPRALLLDEPFAALDLELRAAMRDFVFERTRSQNLPTLLVTHDHEDAKAAGGPVFVLENRTLMKQG